MVYKIENEYLSVTASEKGGELQSVYDKKAKRELLWQGDPQFWADRAPNLFPYIARLTGGKYTYRGKEYSMRIHGIVMYSELKGTVSEEEMSFELTADEATKQAYPFDFIIGSVHLIRQTKKDFIFHRSFAIIKDKVSRNRYPDQLTGIKIQTV